MIVVARSQQPHAAKPAAPKTSSRRQRLCFVIPNLGRGGAERNLVTVLSNIDIERYEIFVVCLEAKGFNLQKINPAAVQLIDLKHPSVYFSVFKIVKAVKAIRPDALIGWMGYLNAYMACFKPFFPKGMRWICRESSIPSIQNRYFNYPFVFTFLYRFLNRYDRIICQSKAMANDLISSYGVVPEKIQVINNPIGFSDGLQAGAAPLKDGRYRLLYVGNISREKRVHLLVEALQRLPANYSLTILGDGTELPALRQQIGDCGLTDSVTIRTDCFDPMPDYLASDCMLLCSNHEGFPNVVVEAMGAGCPVIGFNIQGGANEILENYGGFAVTKPDVESFAATIRQVCETEALDRQRIAATARSVFDTKKIINSYEEAFN